MMNNNELKKKIVEIIINAIWKDAEADYDSTDETEARSIADALIAAGIGDVERIQSENAALRERLERSVEFPRIVHPNEMEWHIQYQNEYGIIYSEIRFSKKAAEARLAELKGETK